MKRRNFLKMLGAGAATSAFLPLLESSGAAAAGSQHPTRLVVFFSANGTIPFRWRPEGDTRNFEFKSGDILEALNPWRDKLVVLDGLDMVSARNGPGDGHQTGMGHMLTGTELLSGNTKGGCDSCPAAGYSSGPSVDQYIAQRAYGPDMPTFESMTFAVQPGGPNNWTRMSYAGEDLPVEPYSDPFAAYDRIFETVGLTQAELERVRARRSSVLDFVSADLQDINAKVSSRDRQRIDQHLSSIRQLEQSMMTGEDGFACAAPGRGEAFDHRREENFPATGRAMMDLIATSLACDLTRVASLQWSRSVSQVKHTWAGVSDPHHDLSHRSFDDDTANEELVKINRWYADQFAYLIDRLDSIPEGDGTVLDHTVVIWTNELGEGNSHTRNNVPIVMAGGANGFFETGRYHTFDQREHNDLLVSLCQAMGLPGHHLRQPQLLQRAARSHPQLLMGALFPS